MNYEQKYKDALERAKTLYENANGMILKKWVEQVFPELKESEDERIRKALLQTLQNRDKYCISDTFGEVNVKDAISWLEKQGKIIDEYEDKLDRCACESFNKGYEAALEKQGGQKPDIPTWNEEDERIFDSIIEDVTPYGECPDYPTDEEREYFYEGNKKVEWLKFIKERLKGE